MPQELNDLILEASETHRSPQACLARKCEWRNLFDIHSQHLTHEILAVVNAYWVSAGL